MSEFRMDRLGEQVKEEIAKLIMTGRIKDPRVSTFLSINQVEISGDLAYAKVYVSSFMDKKQTIKGVEGLNSAASFIQATLGKKLRIRQIPKFTFIFDDSIKDGIAMIKKIDEITANDVEVAKNRDSENNQ